MQECTQHIWGRPVKGRLILLSGNQSSLPAKAVCRLGVTGRAGVFQVDKDEGKNARRVACKGTEV